jgi:hypothetical protein
VREQLAVAAGGNIVATGAQVTLAEGRVYAEEAADYTDTHATELNDIQRKIGLSEVSQYAFVFEGPQFDRDAGLR